MNIVAIIPARYASTRLPEKPLIDLCGKPMIQRVYERTKKATLVNRVIVATDHEKITEAVKSFGGEVMLTPSDLKSGSDRIAYVAKNLKDAVIIVNVQGDEPLISPTMIEEAIKPMIDDSKIQMATLVKKITMAAEVSNPNIVKTVLDEDGFALYFSRSPIPFLRNGSENNTWHRQFTYYKHIGLYVFRREFLLQFASWQESALERAERLEQLRIIEHGFKIKATITEYDSIPVDTAEDADRIRTILQQSREYNS
ncbi:MAG: 3-deoxy-manno-octulosonate cytidylyltransferase [Ignavibacteriales bacterium]|nr:3-deoxy-manno-octulosonate cytidylyltransferase [Ignavibacteriales bacterium]